MSQQQVVSRAAFVVLVLLVVLACFLRVGLAQVTFSKDWKPGKRSAYGDESCLTNAKSAATVCHTLMSELGQLAACEARAVARFLQTEEEDASSGQMIFSGGR